MADCDILVAGDGLAGLTAALFSARWGYSTLVLGGTPGGALLSVTRVEDFPGFPAGVAGYDLCPSLQEQAMTAGASFRMAELEALEKTSAGWRATAGGDVLEARAVIAATGVEPRELDVPGADRLAGRGISHCASCDGPLHRDGVVGVVGGGDSALLEALELTEYVQHVVVIHRGTAFRAQKAYQDRILSSPKVTVRFETEIEEILGEERVTSVRLRSAGAQEAEELDLAGLFVYIGGAPRTAFLRGIVDLDASGRVVTDTWMRAGLPGLYAVGSIRRDSAEQAVAAAGDGATAAVAAHRYLAGAEPAQAPGTLAAQALTG